MKTHDRDSSGYLDKKETRSLFSEVMKDIGIVDTMTSENYDAMYEKFDKNGDGMILKIEIKQLMMTMLGLNLDSKELYQ